MKSEREIELVEPNARVVDPDAKLVPLPLLSKRLGRNHGTLLKKVEKWGFTVFYFRPRKDRPKLTTALQPNDAVELILYLSAEGWGLPTTDPKAVSELWDTSRASTAESRELIESVIKEALARHKKRIK